jgi:lipopolysaccharide export system protein LptA
VLLIVLAAVGLSSAGEAEEARASVRKAAPASQATDPLFGRFALAESREPVSVKADALEFDYRSRVLTYKGNVVVEQGDVTLRADTLTLALQVADEVGLSAVVADGGVRLSQGERWATAGHAEYDGSERVVVLSENAVLHEGPNQLSGERVLVYLDEERGVVEGGEGRVHAVLAPPREDRPAAETDDSGDEEEEGESQR